MFKKLFLSLFLFGSFSSAQVSLNDLAASSNPMLALQQISVTIGGEFVVNGTFSASSTERVDQFITRIYNTYMSTMMNAMNDENALISFRKKYEKFALRNIELIHKDGTKETLDLAEFRLNGDFANNPYIKEGDLIIIPVLDLETNFVSVTGAVNKSLEFQFVNGDDLQTALFFARGINTSYKNVNKAVITRLEDNGQKRFDIETDINSEFKLKSGDRIQVLFEERNNHNYKVLVLGEVNYPGYIPISRNTTTLKEVLNKAGGFTENASLKFSEVVRDYDSYSALRRESLRMLFEDGLAIEEGESNIFDYSNLEFLKMFRTANLEMRDTLYFRVDNNLRGLEGFAFLDFRNLEIDSSYESNYVVQDGDIIIVPQKRDEIYVWGGVAQTGFYPFEDNFTIWDYINAAGGFSEIAYGDDEVYLIKGKARNWLKAEYDEQLIIEPGDFVYVKKERPQEEFWFYLGRIGAIAGVLGSLATIYLAFSVTK